MTAKKSKYTSIVLSQDVRDLCKTVRGLVALFPQLTEQLSTNADDTLGVMVGLLSMVGLQVKAMQQRATMMGKINDRDDEHLRTNSIVKRISRKLGLDTEMFTLPQLLARVEKWVDETRMAQRRSPPEDSAARFELERALMAERLFKWYYKLALKNGIEVSIEQAKNTAMNIARDMVFQEPAE